MALWLAENQRVRITKIEYKEKHTVINASSSRKDGDKYVYSDWGFVKLVKDAHEYAMDNVLKEGDIIVLNKAFQSKESYLNKENKKMYPKNPQIVVLAIELYRSGANTSTDKASLPAEDDIPF